MLLNLYYIEEGLANAISNTTFSSSFNVYTGLANTEKAGPCIIVSCDDATKDSEPRVKAWRVPAKVTIRELSSTDVIVAAANADIAFESLLTSEISVSGSIVKGIFPQEMHREYQNATWTHTMQYELVVVVA